MPTAASLRAAHAAAPLSGLLVMSPANPSGTMIDETGLRSLAQACREMNLRFISDEIYHGLTYGQPAATALAVDPDAVVINSFSKY